MSDRYEITDHNEVFKLDVSDGRLINAHDDKDVVVEPQTWKLLLLFVRHPGEIQSKEDIQDFLWGKRIVTDERIAKAVSEARKALNDNGRKQSFIRTITRRGYKFTADANPIREEESDFSTKLKAAERRWEYMQSHAFIGLRILFLLKAAVGLEKFQSILEESGGVSPNPRKFRQPNPWPTRTWGRGCAPRPRVAVRH